MNTKLLIPAMGVVLLSSSAAALADEHRGGHLNGPPAFHASNDRDGFRGEGFRGDGFRGDGFRDARPHWREHGHPIYVPAQRWCPPAPRAHHDPGLVELFLTLDECLCLLFVEHRDRHRERVGTVIGGGECARRQGCWIRSVGITDRKRSQSADRDERSQSGGFAHVHRRESFFSGCTHQMRRQSSRRLRCVIIEPRRSRRKTGRVRYKTPR